MIGSRRTIQAIALVVLSLTLNGCAAAATLRPGCTVPTLGNAGTCGAFVAGEALTGTVTANFRWYNADAPTQQFVDAVEGVLPGTTVQLTPRQVPPGRYWIVAWASNLIGPGCADSALVVVGPPPAKVSGIAGQ